MSARQKGLCSRHGFAMQMQGGFACAGSSAVEAFVAGLDLPCWTLLPSPVTACGFLEHRRLWGPCVRGKYEYAMNMARNLLHKISFLKLAAEGVVLSC